MHNKSSLVIFGAWYFSDVIVELAQASGWTVLGRVDPDPPEHVQSLEKVPSDAVFFVAIGSNYQRQYVTEQLRNRSRKLISLFHPNASISPSASIGDGSYIGENASVRTLSTLGYGAIVHAGAVISHHVHVGDYVSCGPNSAISSKSTIGSGTLMGVGCCTRPSCVVGDGCVVGAGAVVVSDFPDNATIAGNPARHINAGGNATKDKSSDWLTYRNW